MSEDRLETLIAGLHEGLEDLKKEVSDMNKKLETIISHEVRLTQAERDILSFRADKRELWQNLHKVNERCISREKEIELVHALDGIIKGTPSPQSWWDSRVSRGLERILVLLAGGFISWLASNWRW